LNDLKKNGLLGRDAILRKTMLDECKGDKFLEVLVVFSTAVVKKVAVPRAAKNKTTLRPISLTLATSATLGPADQRTLIPLALALRSSLSALLRKKADTKARCQQFADLLEQKSDQLDDRLRQCSRADGRPAPPPPSDSDSARVQKEVHENWPGNSKWPQALLYGDDGNAGDQPLKRPFNAVWGLVVSGGTMQPDVEELGLVASLEQRVSDQRARLRTWRAFHDDMVKESVAAAAQTHQNGQPRRGASAFIFNKHSDLRVLLTSSSSSSSQASSEPATTNNTKLPLMHTKFSSIIMDMKQELDEISRPKAIQEVVTSLKTQDFVADKPSYPQLAAPLSNNNGYDNWNRAATGLGSRPLSGTYALNGSTTAVPLSRIFSPAKAFRLNSRSTSNNTSSSAVVTAAAAAAAAVQPTVASIIDGTEPTPPPTPKVVLPEDDSESTLPTNSSIAGDDATSSHSGDYSGDDMGDDMISAAMGSRSPSPGSGRMSLAERTRRSILQANNLNSQSSGTSLLHPHASLSTSKEASTANSVIATGPSVADRRQTLLERTRQSMANLSAAHPKSRKSMGAKQNRQSISYPVNQFETPGRPRPRPTRRDATPTDKLFSGDADYASVFKSRPRVAVSPQPSPHDDDDNDYNDNDLPMGVDVIDEEPEDDSALGIDGDSWITSSPLGRRG
jgi:hypothetical protein